ncbi:MAG: DEAD/DEAH box helicase [Bacteroidaceae bacterium]|nr:DEAD/DEAH box helicase [Bacteroidaceae bacterium]
MTTFNELGLCDELLQAVEEQGYEHPMPVQEQVIPHLLQNEGDLVALAQTGTGKTAAYGLPLLHILWQFIQNGGQTGVPRALILSPTRELCLQIADDLEGFAKFMPEVRVLAVYGGANIEPQIRALKKGVDVIVATPGRLIDLMHRGAAQLQSVHNLVLDEADEMLSMGFQEDLDAILEGMDGGHNTLLFSATMSKEIERIANNYLHEAHTIQVGSRNEGSENVNHIYYMVHAKDKYAALKRVVDFYPRIYAIIFCRTRMETQEVADNLIRDGYNADALHGELSQQQRDLTMQKFRQHRTQLLVATDVAARGLDVDDLTHVINYGMPDDTENYTHRSGRTGRAGKKGTSISIVHVREMQKIKQVEKVIQKEFVRATLPEPREICGKQLYHVIDQIERVEVDEEEIAPFMPEVTKRLEWLDKEDLIKRVVSREFGRFLQYYASAPEIEDVKPGKAGKENKGERRKKGDRTPESGYTRLFCPVSKMDGFYAKELIKLINDHVRGGKVDIGRIDLMKNFSFIEVSEQDAERVIDSLNGVKVHGRRITVEVADAEGGGTQERKADKARGPHRDAREERGNRRDDYGKKRDDFGKKNKRKGDNRRDIEADVPRGKQYKKEDWMKFLHPETNNGLQGPEPDFSEEGWARRYPKKKKK